MWSSISAANFKFRQAQVVSGSLQSSCQILCANMMSICCEAAGCLNTKYFPSIFVCNFNVMQLEHPVKPMSLLHDFGPLSGGTVLSLH